LKVDRFSAFGSSYDYIGIGKYPGARRVGRGLGLAPLQTNLTNEFVELATWQPLETLGRGLLPRPLLFHRVDALPLHVRPEWHPAAHDFVGLGFRILP